MDKNEVLTKVSAIVLALSLCLAACRMNGTDPSESTGNIPDISNPSSESTAALQTDTSESTADTGEASQPSTNSTTDASSEPASGATESSTEATEPELEPTEKPTEPRPTETEPRPTETEPRPTETEPRPTETEPRPTETEPKPTETEPKPKETEPTPTETEPKPTETEPKPTETEPKPTETEPKPTEPIDPILSNFTIVSDWRNTRLTTKLAESIKNAYNVTVPVTTKNAFKGGPAIYIGLGETNSYGGYRFAISADVEKQAIYINGSDNSLTAGCDYLVAKDLLAGEFPFRITKEIYGYAWNSTDIQRTDYGHELVEDKPRELTQGVILHELKYASEQFGTTKAYAIVVKKNANAEVKAIAANWDSTHNEDNPAPVCTVKEFSEQLKTNGDRVLAITNASFFYKGTTNLPAGMQIINGVVRQEPSDTNPKYSANWFGVTYSGRYVIADYKVYNSDFKGRNMLKYAVGGGEIIMTGGVPLAKSTDADFRTAVGINASGDMVLLTVENASYAMIQRVMMDLNMDITTILNLDGGGSTTLYAVDRFENLQRVQCETASDRAVADALAIVLG